MSDKPYSETVKSTLHDPVWWLRLVMAILALIALVCQLSGSDSLIRDVCFDALMVLFGVAHLLEAVRGRRVGSEKPMGIVERVVSAVVSVALIVVFFVALLRSLGIMLW